MTSPYTETEEMFEGEKSMDKFVEKYCSDTSADKCKITTIGYIRDLTRNCDGFIKLIIPMDVINTIFAFYFGIKTSINLRYFGQQLQSNNLPNVIFDMNNYEEIMNNRYIEYQITVPIEASLYDIWMQIQTKINILEGIKVHVPVFTLITTNDFDPAYIFYVDADMYTYRFYRFYSKPNFPKLLHHKMNPTKIWKFYGKSSRITRHDYNYDPYIVFDGNPILCVENARQLPTPDTVTLASSYLRELTKYSTIYIDDYTQIDDNSNQEHNIDDIGSSNVKDVQSRKLVWKIPKGTSLESFFEIARPQCNIADHKEIRLFRIYENEKYLITFPYRFQCKQHRILLERGRYPRHTEVFLMVCIINDDNTPSQFLPLIVHRSKSVKYLKQNVMDLFHLNPAEYKKYICYNIINRHKLWRDSNNLNSNRINPRHGDRIGLKIGIGVIDKKLLIIKDTRNLNKMWDSLDEKCINDTNNPYITQDIGTIQIKFECDLKSLRKQIFNMSQFKNSNTKSYKYLLLSWLDNIYNIPLSFPILTDGKLNCQKGFDSDRRQICVEILNEEIESIPKSSRFLHVHLAKIQHIEEKDNTNINISYWPPTHHIRIIYNEENEYINHNTYNTKSDKITYKKLSQFICKKYIILPQHLLIAMFKVNKGEWMLINDEYDNSKQGLCGPPYHIRGTNRHGQIFAIFDLFQCDIQNIDKDNIKGKIDFINESINKCGAPPLSNKAAFYYKHYK